MTSQHVIAALLVAVAMALVIRRLVLTARGKGGCGCCGDRDQCPSGSEDGGTGGIPSKDTAEHGTRNK